MKLASRFLLAGSVVAALSFASCAEEPQLTPEPKQSPTQIKPAHDIGGEGFILVQNWDFGTAAGNTIRNQKEMDAQFQYHDQFGTIANGTKYGAVIVASDESTALKNLKQPVEGKDTNGKPVREFTADSLKTYLVPLNGATELHPEKHNVGNGSFQAKWVLPAGGSLLQADMVWETRVRMVTPPYFWFAIWAAGNKWNKGAEVDVVESFGYDNGGGYTNFDGRFWHSDIVGKAGAIHYHSNWAKGMAAGGIKEFDATQWHTWTWLYRADNTLSIYVDGVEVQTGATPWTLKTEEPGEPLNMSFIFDAGWGHREVKSVNKPLTPKDLEGKYYEWDYSRVYLRPVKR